MRGELTAYLWIVWDIAAVLILALCIHSGAARGFLRAIISLAGYVAAVLAGNLLSPILAQALYDSLVKDAIRLIVMNRLEESAGAGADEIASAFPEGLRGFLTGDAVERIGGELGSEVARVVEDLVDAALREPVLSILRSLIFLVLFTVVLILARNLSRLFAGVYRVPVLGTANTLLGGVVGVLEAALVLLIASLVLRLAVGFTGGWFWLNERIMDDTYIWRVFWNAAAF